MFSFRDKWRKKVSSERAVRKNEHIRIMTSAWIFSGAMIFVPLAGTALALRIFTIMTLVAGYLGALVLSRINAPAAYLASAGVWIVLCLSTSLLVGATEYLSNRLIVLTIVTLVILVLIALIRRKGRRRRPLRRDEQIRASQKKSLVE